MSVSFNHDVNYRLPPYATENKQVEVNSVYVLFQEGDWTPVAETRRKRGRGRLSTPTTNDANNKRPKLQVEVLLTFKITVLFTWLDITENQNNKFLFFVNKYLRTNLLYL